MWPYHAKVGTLILLIFVSISKPQNQTFFNHQPQNQFQHQNQYQTTTVTEPYVYDDYQFQPQNPYQPQHQYQTTTVFQYITYTNIITSTVISTPYFTQPYYNTVTQYITQTHTVPQYTTQTVPQYITQTQVRTQYQTQYITNTRTVAQYITSMVVQENTITKSIPSYVTRTVTQPSKQQQQCPTTGAATEETPGITKGTGNSGVLFPSQDTDIPKGSCGHSTQPKIDERIANGQESSAGRFPWMVLLSFFSAFHQRNLFCGASLVSKQWIMTAAHCFRHLKPNLNVHVYIGYLDKLKPRNGSELFSITKENIIIHDEFSTTTLENDIALARLPQALIFNSAIQTICLSTNEQIPFGSKAYAAGWGLLDSGDSEIPNVLHEVELDVLEEDTCENNQHFICTYTPGKDTCQGDSGGPLMVLDNGAWYQVGIISSGPMDCGQHSSPGVYTRLPKYLNFITSWIYD